MLTEREIAVVHCLLDRCDRDERRYIAGLAMAAALETYPREERHAALARAWLEFGERLDRMV